MKQRFAILIFLLTALTITNVSAQWAEPISKPTDEKFYKQMDKLIAKAQEGKKGERVGNGYLLDVAVYRIQLEKYLKEKGYYYLVIKQKINDSTNYEWFVTQLVVDPNRTLADYKSQQENNKEQLRKQKEEQKRKEEEQIRIEYENKRALKNVEIENQYNVDVVNAKNRANSTPGLTFIQYSDGYYIGSVKDGKRDGFGEYYYKNTSMKEEIYTRNISYIGMWKDDEFNGNGKFSFGKRNVARSIFNVVIADYWIQYTSSCNFVDGLQEGEGVLTTKSYDDVSMERLLYSQGKIIRNYTKEANDKRSEESFQRYQAQKKITDCNNCTVDEEKTTFPKEGYFLMFSYDEPGKIVMKNGEKYDFYYKEGEKPWYIIDSYGIMFDDTTDFTSFDEMITELIKRCILKKCK